MSELKKKILETDCTALEGFSITTYKPMPRIKTYLVTITTKDGQKHSEKVSEYNLAHTMIRLSQNRNYVAIESNLISEEVKLKE